MNPELMVYKGQLATHRAQRLNLDAEASAAQTSLRLLLRLGQEPTQLNMDQVKAMTARLDHVVTEMRRLDKQIAELEAALG